MHWANETCLDNFFAAKNREIGHVHLLGGSVVVVVVVVVATVVVRLGLGGVFGHGGVG